MSIQSIKSRFLASFPVIGPHADIEADLMLAGKKPITWVFVAPDEARFDDPRMQRQHEGRKRLDKAVEEGRLIAIDVEQRYDEHPEYVGVYRHYAQPENEEKLKQVVAFNKQAFNGRDVSQVELDKDMGHYLGYRRRDIFFFNNVINAPLLPEGLRDVIIRFNAPCQQALGEKLLAEVKKSLDTTAKKSTKFTIGENKAPRETPPQIKKSTNNKKTPSP
tara:strand:- start:1580 stop:2236 length:657 start_codon:yes stop_codon:yes gene_type:complete